MTRPLARVPGAGARRGDLAACGAQLSSGARRLKRHQRERNKISGTTERPRLAVFRSNNHIYAQVIDDTANDGKGHTLVSYNSRKADVAEGLEDGASTATQEAATIVGKRVAELALAQDVEKVVFDKGGHLYHGRVAAVAEGARAGGLDF